MNLTKGGSTSISLAATGECDPIWLDSKEDELSIQIDEVGGPGDHVGTFYVKVGNSRDTTNWQTKTLAVAPTAVNGVAVHHVIEVETGTLGVLLGYTCTGGSGTIGGDAVIKRR